MTTLLAFFVLLGVLITIHELGHFVVAKLCGVKVLTFSIGFGPKLIGFTRGDTEYRLSVLPFGGYVRMYGDDITAEVPEAERHLAYLEKSTLQKMAIAFAGPAANLLLTVFLFFAIGIGEETVPLPVVGSVIAGEPADRAGIKAGDRIVAVEGKPVAVFADLVVAVAPRAELPTTLTIERPGEAAPLTIVVTPAASPSQDPTSKKSVGRLGLLTVKALPVVTVAANSPAAVAGVVHADRVVSIDGVDVATRDEFFNRLDAADGKALALVIERKDDKGIVASHTITLPATAKPPIEPTTEPAPTEPTDAAPIAAEPTAPPVVEALTFAVTSEEVAGPVAVRVQATRDAVVAAVELQQRRRGLASVDGIIAAVEPDSPASARALQVNGHRVVAVDGKPLQLASDLPLALAQNVDDIHVLGLVDKAGNGATFSLYLQPAKRRELGGQKIVGATLTSAMGGAATLTRDVGVVEAFRRAIVGTGETIRGVAMGYVMLFTGQVGLDQLGGPVMLANIAGEAARSGVSVFVGTMALISVNLALLNLLPVPILDGGHILLFTIEAIRRKRLSVEARIRATKIGLFFVGGLMLLALFNDVTSFFK